MQYVVDFCLWRRTNAVFPSHHGICAVGILGDIQWLILAALVEWYELFLFLGLQVVSLKEDSERLHKIQQQVAGSTCTRCCMDIFPSVHYWNLVLLEANRNAPERKQHSETICQTTTVVQSASFLDIYSESLPPVHLNKMYYLAGASCLPEEGKRTQLPKQRGDSRKRKVRTCVLIYC